MKRRRELTAPQVAFPKSPDIGRSAFKVSVGIIIVIRVDYGYPQAQTIPHIFDWAGEVRVVGYDHGLLIVSVEPVYQQPRRQVHIRPFPLLPNQGFVRTAANRELGGPEDGSWCEGEYRRNGPQIQAG